MVCILNREVINTSVTHYKLITMKHNQDKYTIHLTVPVLSKQQGREFIERLQAINIE